MTLHTFPGMFCSLTPLKSRCFCSFEHLLHCILFSLAQVSSILAKNLFYVRFCLFKQGSSEFSGSFRRLSPAYPAQKSYISLTQIMFKRTQKGLLQNSATQIAITISKISEKANNAKKQVHPISIKKFWFSRKSVALAFLYVRPHFKLSRIIVKIEGAAFYNSPPHLHFIRPF